jgi:hypothetical protein
MKRKAHHTTIAAAAAALVLALALLGPLGRPSIGAAGVAVAPSPPSWVTATEGEYPNKVRITWASSSSAATYLVYRIEHGYYVGWDLRAGVSGTIYDDYGADPGQIYDYAISACSNNDYTDCSSRSDRDLGYRPLDSPTVVATDGSWSDKVRMSWSAVENAVAYEVSRANSDGSGRYVLAATVGQFYDDTTAVPGTDYRFYVQAQGAHSNYPNNDSPLVYDLGYRRISAPNNVMASDGWFVDYVNVTWSSVWGADYYKVHRGPEDDYYTITWDVGSALSYQDYSPCPLCLRHARLLLSVQRRRRLAARPAINGHADRDAHAHADQDGDADLAPGHLHGHRHPHGHAHLDHDCARHRHAHADHDFTQHGHGDEPAPGYGDTHQHARAARDKHADPRAARYGDAHQYPRAARHAHADQYARTHEAWRVPAHHRQPVTQKRTIAG